jgi:hypothetical protein
MGVYMKCAASLFVGVIVLFLSAQEARADAVFVIHAQFQSPLGTRHDVEITLDSNGTVTTEVGWAVDPAPVNLPDCLVLDEWADSKPDEIKLKTKYTDKAQLKRHAAILIADHIIDRWQCVIEDTIGDSTSP